MTNIERKGVALILSSPSGAGKSTIVKHLTGEDSKISLSVSMTTRKRRSSEINGTHYHFVLETDFMRLRDTSGFIEWAEVHGNFYGTPLEQVETAFAKGRDVLCDVDYQGGQQIMKSIRPDVASIFILPPSMEELKKRLYRRDEDIPEVIENRLINARIEISHWREYDYVVVNDDLQTACEEVTSILGAERLRQSRQVGMENFVNELLS